MGGRGSVLDDVISCNSDSITEEGGGEGRGEGERGGG